MSSYKTVLEWDPAWKAECAAHHLGLWLIERRWFQEAVGAVKAGLWRPTAPRVRVGPFTPEQIDELRGAWAEPSPSMEVTHKNGWSKSLHTVQMPGGEITVMSARARRDDDDDAPSIRPYLLDSFGLAFIGIDGQMMKGESKFGGANTLRIRRAVRMAKNDPEVKAIMLAVDSPGGTVAGTQELAADVADAAKVKPVYAHIDDLGASAAYWVAAQTRRITASPTAEVGSIGVVAVVDDTSGAAEKKGIVVHVVSTGPYKGTGADGAPITQEQLAYLQDRIDAIHAHFLEAVSKGRNQPLAVVQEWASGKVWIADVAKRMGLVDDVYRMDEAVAFARAEIAAADAASAAAASASVTGAAAAAPTAPVAAAAPVIATITGDAAAQARLRRTRDATRRAEINRRIR